MGINHEFGGEIRDTISESTKGWPTYDLWPKGAPNVVMIVLDDVGFGQLGCFGSSIETPNMDAIAARGLRYTNWHTTAVCSPTRSCLLTGRNHHTNGFGCISETATGFPGYNAFLPDSSGMLGRILKEHGYSSFAVGKWHLTPSAEMGPAGPWERWPIGKGFDRYYGFLPGETHQYYPELVSDNSPVEPPATPEEGYTLNEDLADRAIAYVRDLRQSAPERPFFLYYAPGAQHAPHHVPKEWADRYAGCFDHGWDEERRRVLERQVAAGIMPAGTELPDKEVLTAEWDANEYSRALDAAPADWDSLEPDQRRLYARMQEVYAGFMTHTDHHVGRVIDAIEAMGALDDTMVILVSDNGASAEGGPHGSFNEYLFFNQVQDTWERNLEHIDELGGPRTFNHYPSGWAMAGNAPFKMWKRYVLQGGIADPCIISWPRRIDDAGGIRTQYHHAVDIVPTILESVGVEAPTHLDGVEQEPIHGVSMAYTFDDAQAPTTKQVQYYEMLGMRALWADGWKLVAQKAPMTDTDRWDHGWELYHTDEDPTEQHDVAAEHPEKVAELVELWWREARRYGVLPLDDSASARLAEPKPDIPGASADRTAWEYAPGASPVPLHTAIDTIDRDFTARADITFDGEDRDGFIIGMGGYFGGWAMYVREGRLRFRYSYLGLEFHDVVSDAPLPTSGRHAVEARFRRTGPNAGSVTLLVDDAEVASGAIPETCPVIYSLGGGLSCGWCTGDSVVHEETSPFTFQATLHKVTMTNGPRHGVEDLDAKLDHALAHQ